MINNVKIGADPEIVIWNNKTNKPISSVGLIPGTKDKPYTCKEWGEGFGMQKDNVLGEFNIPACSNFEEFKKSIQFMKGEFNKILKSINPDYGYRCLSSATYDPEELKSPEANEYGCDPDYNVYTETYNERPKKALGNVRACGFHIHISYDNPNIETSLMLVRYLDAVLGLSSVLYDTDTKRRKLYGNAGSFRLKSYGVEYRSLGGVMLKEANLKLVWDLIMEAIHQYNHKGSLPDPIIIQDLINNSRADKVKNLLKK